MKNNTLSCGYIMVLSLVMMSLAIVMVTTVLTRSVTYVSRAKIAVEREQARQLALGGIQIAAASIAAMPEEDKSSGKKAPAKNNPDQMAKDQLIKWLPLLNSWQTFTFEETRDGIDGSVRVCVMSEDGKINLNELYDFAKHRFVGDDEKKEGENKKFMREIFKRIEEQTQATNLFESFENFMKERQYKLNDVTELMNIDQFKVFKSLLFYEPAVEQKDQQQQKRPVFLTDIFTVASGKKTIEPWMFSDSMSRLLGMRRVDYGDQEQKKHAAEGWVKNFTIKPEWKKDWNKILQPMYNKSIDQLPPTLLPLLSTSFMPTRFSVLSSATVGNVTQRLFAFVELTLPKDGGQISVTTKKVYWL